METHFYIIIAVLLVLKIIFWMCICWVRASRRQTVVVVERQPGTRQVNTSDRADIIGNELPPDSSWGAAPPPYSRPEVKNYPKPPAYDKVV